MLKYRVAQFLDGGNIDRQHLRPPVLAILLEIIERENFDGLLRSLAPNLSIFSPSKGCFIYRICGNFRWT